MLLGFDEKELEQKKGIFTATEIAQQPETWKKTMEMMTSGKEKYQSFISEITKEPGCDIILTGAGSSEYVGNALCPSLIQTLNGRVRSVGTTDIVASPELYLSKDRPTLLISFARSGDSPESVGAVKAADRICGKIRHVFITCNKDGALAKMAEGDSDKLLLLLAPETNDKSFAMTSSFSSMYFAALLLLDPDSPGPEGICGPVASFVSEGYKKIFDWVNGHSYDRIVYLGTDALKDVAQESCLKVLELTAGKMLAVHDSPMGSRHGP